MMLRTIKQLKMKRVEKWSSDIDQMTKFLKETIKIYIKT